MIPELTLVDIYTGDYLILGGGGVFDLGGGGGVFDLGLCQCLKFHSPSTNFCLLFNQHFKIRSRCLSNYQYTPL